MDAHRDHGSSLAKALAVLLGVTFLIAGLSKLAGLDMMVESFRGWGYPVGLMYVVGVIEIAAAVMIFTSRMRFAGAVLIALLMAGAAVTHVVAREWIFLPAPVIMLALAGFVAWTERAAPGRKELHA